MPRYKQGHPNKRQIHWRLSLYQWKQINSCYLCCSLINVDQTLPEMEGFLKSLYLYSCPTAILSFHCLLKQQDWIWSSMSFTALLCPCAPTSKSMRKLKFSPQYDCRDTRNAFTVASQFNITPLLKKQTDHESRVYFPQLLAPSTHVLFFILCFSPQSHVKDFFIFHPSFSLCAVESLTRPPSCFTSRLWSCN